MPDVVDRETSGVQGVLEREHVATGKGEQLLHPVPAQCRQREVATMALDDLSSLIHVMPR
ncbi:hypothetical protein BH24ACT9_BH24ACT9_01660 [soil metagenome]